MLERKTSIAQAAEQLQGPFTHTVFGRVDDYCAYLSRFVGSYKFHQHVKDEMYMVLEGDIFIDYYDGPSVPVRQGDPEVSIYDVAPDAAVQFLYDGDFCPITYGGQPSVGMPWKLMAGRYTRYGEVGELLREADDCYVIMSHGDELTLRFPAEAFGPVPKGLRRTFILKTDSYCKDMDLYTAWPDTVEPLPFHAMSGYPYGPNEHYPDNAKTRSFRNRYNTRVVHGRP